MKRLGFIILGIIFSLFTLSIPISVLASNIDFTMEIYPESHRDEYFHGNCCAADQLSNASKFPMYQQFTPTTINRITKINLEFTGTGNEDYTIYLTDNLNNRLASATSNIQVSGMIEFEFDQPIVIADSETIYQIELTQASGGWSLAYDDLGGYERGHAKTGGSDYPDKDYHFEIWGYLVEPEPEEEDPPADDPIDDDDDDGDYVPSRQITESDSPGEIREEIRESVEELFEDIEEKLTQTTSSFNWFTVLPYAILAFVISIFIILLIRKRKSG